MELLNNWLVQVIIGNIIWIFLCNISKKVQKFFEYINETPASNSSTKLYPKELLKKQFNISFKVSSISTIVIFVILANNLQYKLQFLFILLIIVVIFCYLFMLGAFDGATEYFDK